MPVDRRLYIYYRVPELRLPELLPLLQRAQFDCLARIAGLRADVLRRPEAADGWVTVMETYASEHGIDEAAQQLIEARVGQVFAALALDVPRHVEVFDRLG